MVLQPKQLKSFILPVLWALFILFACGANPGTLQKLQLSDLFTYDKPIHALLFGTQAWLLIRAGKAYWGEGKSSRIILWSCVASALFGVLIEWLQLMVFEGRSYDYFDMIANAFGCVIVFAIFKYKQLSSKKSEKRI